jgi:light-regulated signal transduction histidine kinase (bacteriophytochrome)
MNVPIFDGPRIVIVAGVGNKASPYDESDVRQLTLLMQGMWQLVVRRRTQEALLAAHDSLEARVMQRTLELAQSKTELERSNQDLEQFAYAASHDLQEPLRMVTSYVQLLQRRYQGQLDAAADEFIGFAVDGARRMQQLINDLLSYSRVNSRGHEFAPVDCGAALDDAVSNLSAAIAEHGAEIVRDPLPTVVADRTQLVQLFQNLVGNAIKFRGPQPPQVHVAAENDDCQWRFAVRDNGIGIDPKYAAQVFLVFRRLHTRAKYPGTGIGLAICKRIVERHGGRIWFESSPGQGATFYFTIPEQPPPA